MLKSQKISRRSALKSLFIVSALPTVFISSCTKSLTSPEIPTEGESRLYKTHLDSEIASLKHMPVVNINGIAEIPNEYLHKGKSGKGVNLVLIREGENDFILFYRKIKLIDRNSTKTLVKVEGLNDGEVLIAKPASTIKILGQKYFKELKRKFIYSAKMKRGASL